MTRRLQAALLVAAIAAFTAAGVALLRAGSVTRVAPGIHVPLPPSRARTRLERGLDSLAAELGSLDTALATRSSADTQRAFRHARSAYKRVESLLYYYSPTAAAALNGPVEEDDADAPPAPLGRQAEFQTIESIVFDGAPRAAAAPSVARMRHALASFRTATVLLDVSDTAVLDAARLEVARVATLGVAEFDAGPSGDAITEAADALDGIRATITELAAPATDPRARGIQKTLIAALDSAVCFLRANRGVETMDRLAFITGYVTPAARAIRDLRGAIDSAPIAARRAWRPSAATLFDTGAFDAWAYAPEYALSATPAVVARGESLFFDPRLSRTGARSCSSCHVPSRGFSDGRAHAASLDTGSRAPLRNTPALLNVALQPSLFADQRAGTLEDQVRAVLSSRAEMNALPATVDSRETRIALAAYLRSLTTFNSRFDRAIRGDTAAMSASERHGFTLFMGKARCGTCHFAPLFSGVMPPDFARSELEIIGVPGAMKTSGAVVDTDSGRARVDGLGVHAGAFKTPTLRNIAMTAPYMHNGVFPTLDAVVDFYNAGGGIGIGERLARQTLPSSRLGLTTAERRDLVAFLRSLTDSSALRFQSVTVSSRSGRRR